MYPLVNNYLGNFVTVGKRLKEEREKLGLSQTDFAAIGGVGRKSQFNYEENERKADTAYLEKIAGIGADVRYIITGDRKGQPPLVLTADEQVLLNGFRALDEKTRKRMLAFVLSGDPPGGKVNIHGQVGNQIEKNEGEIKIDMRSKK